MLEFTLGVMLGWKEEFSHFRDRGIGGRVADRGGEPVCVCGRLVVEFDRQWGSGGSDRVRALHINSIIRKVVRLTTMASSSLAPTLG